MRKKTKVGFFYVKNGGNGPFISVFQHTMQNAKLNQNRLGKSLKLIWPLYQNDCVNAYSREHTNIVISLAIDSFQLIHCRESILHCYCRVHCFLTIAQMNEIFKINENKNLPYQSTPLALYKWTNLAISHVNIFTPY